MFLDEMIPNALRRVEQETGFPLLDGRKLIVGVSGGADSLTLLHTLCHVSNLQLSTLHSPLSTLLVSQSPNLLVAHLNHQLRPSAAKDAHFVATIAKKWGVRARVGEADVAALAREHSLSLEEAGRKARYSFLAEVAREEGAMCVLVAHHADDQVETILMHILRGSGLAGLRGMPLVGPLPDAPDLLLVRPFLTVDPTAIKAYCRVWRLEPLQDETNQDTTFFRNRLRHKLLPHLAQYSPQINQRLQQLAAVVAADYELLEQVADNAWTATVAASADGWVQFDSTSWRGQPLSIRRSLLRRAVIHCHPYVGDMGFETIEQARLIAERAETGALSMLPGGVTLRVDYQRLTVTAVPDLLLLDFPQLPTDEPLLLSIPGRVALADGWVLTAERVMSPDLTLIQQNTDPWQAFVALTEQRPLEVRPRRSGERFQPLGMDEHSAAIKELMINHKIPALARRRWPIVATSSHPVWLVGHVLDRRARVTESAQRTIQLRCSSPVRTTTTE